MNNNDVLITPQQFADAYTRTFLPDISDYQQPPKQPTKGKKRKKG